MKRRRGQLLWRNGNLFVRVRLPTGRRSLRLACTTEEAGRERVAVVVDLARQLSDSPFALMRPCRVGAFREGVTG
jgi:hypothetical protein